MTSSSASSRARAGSSCPNRAQSPVLVGVLVLRRYCGSRSMIQHSSSAILPPARGNTKGTRQSIRYPSVCHGNRICLTYIGSVKRKTLLVELNVRSTTYEII